MRSGLFLTLTLLFGGAGAASAWPPDEMTGRWTGECEIVVSWTTARRLPVEVTIRSDGSVVGRVGDAALVDGRLRPNRGTIGRALNLASDYIIVGRLEGCVLNSEGICRESVKLPLDWDGERFAGGLHTSGTHVGGRKRMVLSARRLVLSPVRP